MNKIQTTLLNEEWCRDFYFHCLEKKKNTETENLEIINKILSLDKDTTSLVELFLVDPIYAPKLLSPRECDECEKKSYSIVMIAIKTSRLFLCRECIEKHFFIPVQKVDKKI